MAMSDSSSNPGDHWLQFYQGRQGSVRQVVHPHSSSSTLGSAPTAADATVITTTTTATTSNIRMGSTSSGNTYPSNESRVGRPARRRSRASRRAPTTLLNTDTTNFRAMVQQFTGAPTAPPFASGAHTSGPSFNFEFGSHDRRQGATGPPVRPYFHQQHHQYSYQPQQQQQRLGRGGEEPMFPLEHHGGDVFLQGFNNPRPQFEESQGFLESFSSHLMSRQPASTESDTSGYIL